MKKIGKRFSYITKIFLVLGLLFSNLSGLSVVFAYENEAPFGIEIKDNRIVINYNDQEELDDKDNIKLTLKENYKYLDDTTEEEVNDSYNISGTELKNKDGYEMVSPTLDKVVFDGLYEVVISLYDETTDEEIGVVNYSYNVEFEKGLDVKVYDLDDKLLTATDEVYATKGDIKLVSSILPGGLKPTDTFMYEGVEYTAEDLLGIEITQEVSFYSLYGEYTLTQEIKVNEDTPLERVFSKDINVMYGEYEDNSQVLNEVTTDNGLDDRYYFFSDSEDGILYVYPSNDEGYSINDLFKILDDAIFDSDIKYIISNSDSEDLEESYQEYLSTFDDTTLEKPMTREEYYQETYINNDTVITLYNDWVSLTYKALLVGDMNNDLVINEEDVKLLINQVVGASEEDTVTGDVYKDEEINTLDVIRLYGVYKNNTWNDDLAGNDMTTKGELVVDSNDIVSGDEFVLRYVLRISSDKISGLAGMINYDKEMLELVGIETLDTFIGSNYEGKFLYLGDDELTGTMNEGTQEYEEEEYTVLTLTFKAKKAGTSTVSISDNELFNSLEYYDASEMEVSTEVIVNASSDNTLSSLTVAGVEIQLEENVLDYVIEVDNDKTEALVEAITNNSTAKISSINAPLELVVGENEISITVVAENGDELVYTVKVIRKEAPKEETATNMNYQNNDNDNNTPNDNTPKPDDNKSDDNKNTEPEEEDGKLSRIIIIILILLVIAGLIYLIFKDDQEDEEERKTNKEIDKLKKEKEFPEVKKEKVNKPNTNKNNKNTKKGR